MARGHTSPVGRAANAAVAPSLAIRPQSSPRAQARASLARQCLYNSLICSLEDL
ncbi:hypothetical protein BAUCODRAFT_38931 [Baudoinia panamericana UAMH 10762]|uniref:Uncharacterized protein n=1 Tax=Baudoinia panamericana (strain UAMH 10762) TaxID=717646 RepID=M2M590_BAUPA|nr:uncharacterized protein BAUCODRAFT_38931 [Baudoinia panamericana UAMH 10762]EMC91791.1 hypothetical protein BAUCODRAFT_38931 [Baudoinia panamericana UAMH 10762]